MQAAQDFDKNVRRKKILLKYTTLVFVAYAITQIATLGAYLAGISSVRLSEVLLLASISLGVTAIFLLWIRLKNVATKKFANFVFFGQFAVWLVMYSAWFLVLREVRGAALFCALMALSFLLSNANLVQSLIVTASATLLQIAGSYVAIVHLKQPGSLGVEIFYALCFLPAALFICNLSDQYARQRSEVKAAKSAAEQSRDAAHQLNAELEKALKMVHDMSIHDELTGLFNRRHLMDVLSVEKNRADRTGQLFSIVVVDIDHFKLVNDSFGHLKGDEVLKEVANALQKTLRGCDFSARFGGEEFMMILGQASADGAMACAERIRRLIEATRFPGFGDDFKVTVSMGLTEYRPVEDISESISRADQALYRAKNAGRNRVEYAKR